MNSLPHIRLNYLWSRKWSILLASLPMVPFWTMFFLVASLDPTHRYSPTESSIFGAFALLAWLGCLRLLFILKPDGKHD